MNFPSIFSAVLLIFSFGSQSKAVVPKPIYKDNIRQNVKNVYYPITASWFKDRFSLQAWNETLVKFKSIGGNTAVLRAPQLRIRSASDIRRDPDFQWCGSSSGKAGGVGLPHCVTQAQKDVESMGLKIKGYATYQYEENFSEKIMMCDKYDLRINSSRIYHRLVLPVSEKSYGSCEFREGDEVLLVFTTFAGIDPHYLLLTAAERQNMSVYFGLPAAPTTPLTGEIDSEFIHAYYQFVTRVLADHAYRYKFYKPLSGTATYGQMDRLSKKNIFPESLVKMSRQESSLLPNRSNVLIGYYSTDQTCLADVTDSATTNQTTHLSLYKVLGNIIRSLKKKFMISPYIILNRSQRNYTLDHHVRGFELILNSSVVDIIAVQEGRGAGKGCYYFETQIDKPIAEVDAKLADIVHYLNPSVPPNVTYRQQFIGSNNELFKMLSDSHEKLVNPKTHTPEFWLNVEAFEYLRDDPCLPLDPRGSGMAELLDRTTKSRIDWALAVGGLYVTKVISFAWDPDFMCKSRGYNDSLADEIHSQSGRPILMYCGWHSRQNMSIVLIGHGLLNEVTQGFNVTYPTSDGATKTDYRYPYYVEADWGSRNHRIPSLIYTQLFDPQYLTEISMNGTVTVVADDVYHECIFTYDFRDN